jgi:hypothetical protein
MGPWHINDRQLLSDLLQAAVTQYGGQRRAAHIAGISQAILSRLLACTQGELDEHTGLRLHTLVLEEQHHRLRDVFFPEAWGVLMDQFNQWLDTSLQRASLGIGTRLVRTPEGFAVRQSYAQVPSLRDKERALLWRYVRFRSRKQSELIRDAESMLGQHGVKLWTLTLTRILDPLLNTQESGFVQWSWREWRLTDYKRLEQFVELGLRREKLLSRTVSPVRYCALLSEIPVDEFEARFGEGAVERPVKKRRSSQ